MEKFTVEHKGKRIKCRRYSQTDKADILKIFSLWQAYAKAAKRIGKSPQISSAFSQAFCCLRLGLVESESHGVDALEIDGTGTIQKAVEIKSTSTKEGRSDIRLFAKSATGSVNEFLDSFDMDFEELIWLSLLGEDSTQFKIYRVLPEEIKSYLKRGNYGVRGGRVNVGFADIVKSCNLQPTESGAFSQI